MQMLRCILFGSFLFLFCDVPAQQFGGNPPSVKWNQINTDTVRIIFPQGFETKAQRIANIVHTLQKNYAHTIGDTIRKISIVIQNQTLVSNGYVGLGPYRSEFYTSAPQNPFELGAVSWPDLLAVHEFRHVQQYSNFNKGLSKFARVILGEQGQLVANAAAVPDWFFEGDAVFNETKLTMQGRGVLPFFLASYQSLSLANRHYSFMKMRNGSLRNYVPDHYDLGYLLVSYGRKKYGDNIWHTITDDAARFRPLFYPFQGAVKKHTGISYSAFVNNAMQYYNQEWQTLKNEKPEWYTNTSAVDVINYQFPYRMEDGSLLVVKSSYRHIPAFYKIDADKHEERITVKDISPDNYFSYNNGRIVYAASQPDTRWSNRDFTSIRLLDIRNHEQVTIASHTRYFSPDISHDGKTILAVETDPFGQSRIVVMNREGVITDSLPKSDVVFSQPKFASDDAHYYAAARNPVGQMSLVKYALHDNRPGEILVPLSNRIIGFLNVQNDTLLFTTTFEGRDELWAIIDAQERRGPFRLASYPTGLYQGVLQSDGTLIGSAFTADGYRLGVFQPLWQRAGIRDELNERYINDVFKNDVYPLQDRQMLQSLPQKQYDITKYPKAFHLLNIHSWRPYYEAPEYSFTLYGQNVLNTLQSEIAYTYNENENSHRLSYNGVYGATYLQPVFGINQTWQRTAFLTPDTAIHWNELSGYAGLQLPLNLSGGKQYRYLTFLSTYNIDQISWTGFAQKALNNTNFQFLQNRIVFSSQSQQSVQQIYPHFAQTLMVQYRNVINKYTAHQLLATASLYFPGLGNNHSFVLTGAYHHRDTLQQYLFSNNFPFSRGYNAVDFPEMWKIGANYHFPLAYPDWGFGNIVYFLRARANLFFDYTQGKSIRTGTTYPFKTAGTEIFFDTRWWNQQPVTFGFRYSRLIDNEFRGNTQPNVWEFILPVTLFN